MNFCICNEIFQDWLLQEQFQIAAELGFDAIEIAPFTIEKSVRDIDRATRRQIQELSADSGVAVAGIHWLLAETVAHCFI